MVPLVRLVQGRNSATASSREPISQHSPSVSQSSLRADWKLTRIQQSWEQFRGQFRTSTQQERLLEVCRRARHQQIGWQFSAGLGHFSAESQEELVPGTCWETAWTSVQERPVGRTRWPLALTMWRHPPSIRCARALSTPLPSLSASCIGASLLLTQ